MDDGLLEGGEWLDGPDGIPLPPLPQHLTMPPDLMPLHFGVDMSTGDGDGGEEILDTMISDTMDTYMDGTAVDPPQIPGGLPMDDTSITPQVSTTPVPQGSLTPQPTSQPHEPLRDSDNDDRYWKRFDVLPSAPTDHAFYDKPVAQPSRAFMARLHKEYRALSTGLPGKYISTHGRLGAYHQLASIIVRAYEDRGDLLRSLIIGPENTPYEDAPFVIDWMLDTDFPQSPPVAFFISWTNGNGRVNP